MNFNVFIPVFPPGLNQTYKVGQGRFYKTKEAKDWQAQAALIIGSEAAIQGWENDSDLYDLLIEFNHPRQDVDAPLKLIMDTVAQKLGFDDKRIEGARIRRKESNENGVWITLKSYDPIL